MVPCSGPTSCQAGSKSTQSLGFLRFVVILWRGAERDSQLAVQWRLWPSDPTVDGAASVQPPGVHPPPIVSTRHIPNLVKSAGDIIPVSATSL